MNQIHLKLRDNKTAFAPGETLEGRVEWSLDKAPSSIEVRLVWTTSGRGDTDRSVAVTMPVAFGTSSSPFAGSQAVASALSSAPFRVPLPLAPHSFAGTYVALSWTVEVVALPSKATASAPFTLSPGARGPIALVAVAPAAV